MLHPFLKATSIYLIFIAGVLSIQVCSVRKTLGMRSADCYNKSFTSVPLLQSNLEVIDLSFNRIRKIQSNDFSVCSSLKHLYLQDNLIIKVDELAFKNLGSLVTLDMSMNGIHILPPTIFKLPSLQNLYLSYNLNFDVNTTLEKAKPIESPLKRFHIADSDLTKVPDLSVIPTLIEFNVSRNSKLSMKPKHFAGLCNLQLLDLEQVNPTFEDACDCINTKSWLMERRVQFQSFKCVSSSADCHLGEEEKNIFSNCQISHQEDTLKANIINIGIPVVVIFIFLLVLLTVFLIYRRRRKHHKNNKKNRNKNQKDNEYSQVELVRLKSIRPSENKNLYS